MKFKTTAGEREEKAFVHPCSLELAVSTNVKGNVRFV